MYDLLIGKDTFKAWFAHTNPAYQHLVWYPLAAQNDFIVLAGVPIRGSISKPSILAAIQQQIRPEGAASLGWGITGYTLPHALVACMGQGAANL